MQHFYSVAEVASEFGVSSQAVRNWIASGELLAIQPPPHGNYKIPAQALLVFKQRAGMLPTDELRLPEAEPSREYRSAQELFDELIAPRLRAVGAASVPELLSRAEGNPGLAQLARELLPVYDLYLKELTSSPALAATR